LVGVSKLLPLQRTETVTKLFLTTFVLRLELAG